MSINTMPVRRQQRDIPDTLQSMIDGEKEQFLYELMILIEVAGGHIPIERISEMTIGELFDHLYPNGIQFEFRPIIHLNGIQFSRPHYIDKIQSVVSEAQKIKDKVSLYRRKAKRPSNLDKGDVGSDG